jgi:hypothetical protein
MLSPCEDRHKSHGVIAALDEGERRIEGWEVIETKQKVCGVSDQPEKVRWSDHLREAIDGAAGRLPPIARR